MKGRLIKPSFHVYFENNLDFQPFISFVEESIKKILPPDLLHSIMLSFNKSSEQKILSRLNKLMPLLLWSEGKPFSGTLSVSLVCPADFTHGVGRYITDTLSRWLLPGKVFGVYSVQSLNFQFIGLEQKKFFFHQTILEIDHEKDLRSIRENIPKLEQKIRINIISVKHSRQMISSSKLSIKQKTFHIQEKICSLLNISNVDTDQNVFDHMHFFLFKLLAEEKISQFEKKFTEFLDQKSKIFDRDMFDDIQHFILLLRDPFTATHDLNHICRLSFFQYIFRKSLKREIFENPNKRFINLKFFRTAMHQSNASRNVLGILISMNLLKDNELFEERHIFQALQRCLLPIRRVKDSYIHDKRMNESICIFYIEIEKEDSSLFKLEEIKSLRKKLSRELKEGIENVIHPVFMPRNEEEVMRNILILSQQLKYVNDIPQVIISFDTQNQEELSFSVILLRVLPENPRSLEDILNESDSSLKFHDFEAKEVASLRKKHKKEANVFRVNLSKTNFLRKDYSLDLFKARQCISMELNKVLGKIRDFNGGILSKQHEVFVELKQSLLDSPHDNEFLLENFFYSLSPPVMQSILPYSLLKILFLMLTEVMEHDFKNEHIFFRKQIKDEYLLLAFASSSSDFKNRILNTIHGLKTLSMDCTVSCLEIDEVPCIGYILRCDGDRINNVFDPIVEKFIFSSLN